MFKCSDCGRSDKPVFRSNPKGESAVWKCEEHMTTPIPEDLKDIMNTIAGQFSRIVPNKGMEE